MSRDGSTWAGKGCLGLTAVLLFLGANAGSALAQAPDRGATELCVNALDDDADGTVDEEPCLAAPVSEPVSGDGIFPELWFGSTTCRDLGYGDLFGFKIDSTPSEGVYPYTSAFGVLTGGPEDPLNWVTISDTVYFGDNMAQFNWQSTLPVEAVIVKSLDTNAYVYDPADLADTGVGTPFLESQVSDVEFCYGYALIVGKTASASFQREYTWTIDKVAAPASLSGLIGDALGTAYAVTVERSERDFGHTVSGEIYIWNPASVSVGFTVVDRLAGVSAPAGVSCPSSTIGPREAVTCTYTAEVPDKGTRLNTVVVTTDDPDVPGNTAEALAVFGTEPASVLGFPSVTVTDTQPEAPAPWGPVSGHASWNYPATTQCPTDPALYAAGVYAFTIDNTATIVETGQNDTEGVSVSCYAPVVSKDAFTAYTRESTWEITKAAAPTAHVGFAGDSFASEYVVSVGQTVAERDFAVSGTITVANPNPQQSMTVALSDHVGGVPATLDCGGTLRIPASGSATCGYTATLPAKVDGTNTASVVLNGVAFEATAPWTFGEPTIVIGYPTVNVTDNGTALGSANGGLTSFTYSLPFDCPIDASRYAGGEYVDEYRNTATISETGQTAEALVRRTCYLPAKARVVKTTTEGPDDIGQFPFKFQLVSPIGDVVEEASLSAAGSVAFEAEMETQGTWTVRELLPRGWTSATTSCSFEVDFPSTDVYVCALDNTEMSRVSVLKLTQGSVDPSSDWTFALFAGPDGFGSTALGRAGTFGDADGLLEFLSATLLPVDLSLHATYSMCEESIPAGWSQLVQVDTDGDGTADTMVVPYNPNADESIPQDLGNRCVDLGAATELPLMPGETLAFAIDNRYPGGAPRTPGYWKNWNACTGGGQAENAERNGGWEEGFWLLEDVLDPVVGGGVTWDDILAPAPEDIAPFVISSCKTAVAILDRRSVADGRKMASDAAYTLAMHLLAAQMNFAAGAETCPDAMQAALAAETLLDKSNFNGTGSYLRKGPDYDEALRLAELLDIYNNGGMCGPPE